VYGITKKMLKVYKILLTAIDYHILVGEIERYAKSFLNPMLIKEPDLIFWRSRIRSGMANVKQIMLELVS
jgi:hypothetical protein